MRITEIRADTLTIGPTIVRVFTDEGLVGLSELGWQDPAIFHAHLDRVIRPQLVGHDPLRPGRHWERLTAGTHDLPYPTSTSFAGVIDIALWDLMGKAAGLPIHALLGGAARTEIPLYWSVGAGFEKTPEKMVADVMVGRDQGFDAFKIRMDWGPIRCDVDPAKDLEMARQVRAALGPDVWLGFDANRGYSVGHRDPPGPRVRAAGPGPLRGAAPRARHGRPARGLPGARHPGVDRRAAQAPLGLPRPDRAVPTRTSSSPTSSTQAGSARSSGSSSWPRSSPSRSCPTARRPGSCRSRACTRTRRSCRLSGRTNTPSSTGRRPTQIAHAVRGAGPPRPRRLPAVGPAGARADAEHGVFEGLLPA